MPRQTAPGHAEPYLTQPSPAEHCHAAPNPANPNTALSGFQLRLKHPVRSGGFASRSPITQSDRARNLE